MQRLRQEVELNSRNSKTLTDKMLKDFISFGKKHKANISMIIRATGVSIKGTKEPRLEFGALQPNVEVDDILPSWQHEILRLKYEDYHRMHFPSYVQSLKENYHATEQYLEALTYASRHCLEDSVVGDIIIFDTTEQLPFYSVKYKFRTQEHFETYVRINKEEQDYCKNKLRDKKWMIREFAKGGVLIEKEKVPNEIPELYWIEAQKLSRNFKIVQRPKNVEELINDRSEKSKSGYYWFSFYGL